MRSSRSVVGGTSSGSYRRGAAGRGARGGGEAVQVPGLLGGEVEGAGEGVEDLLGGPDVAALLHALVVVRAHPGQQGQFLTPQPGDAPPRAGFQADVLRPQPGPAGAQELGEFAPGVVGHARRTASMPRRGRRRWVRRTQEKANDRDAASGSQDRSHHSRSRKEHAT